jgi:transposase-like protein
MKANLRALKKRRVYTDEFKRNLVSQFEKGVYSVQQLEKVYGVSNSCIYEWIYKFSTFNDKSVRIVEMKDSAAQKIKDLEKKVKELERIVGQKQINIDFLEKVIDIAKDELDIDIKKNFSTPQSDGSKKTPNS